MRTMLKYRKRTKDFKSTNVWFDPNKVKATSYNWWIMLEKIKGVNVFNTYRYSTTTQRHQYKVRRTMEQVGLSVDLEIECPRGLQDLDSAIKLYERRIGMLLAEVANPRSKKEKNKERMNSIGVFQSKIEAIKFLQEGK